jgi:hypothetical protein
LNQDPWVELPDHRSASIWHRFETAFDFRPSVRPEDWPSFREPAPSVTWNIHPLLLEFNPWQDTRATPYNLALLSALRACVAEDEPVLALDWQHTGYEFFPHRFRGAQKPAAWCIPALPSGEYHIFVTEDHRLGSLGHPWEQSLCVFGEGFVEAYQQVTPLGSDQVVRFQPEVSEQNPPRLVRQQRTQPCPRRRFRRRR